VKGVAKPHVATVVSWGGDKEIYPPTLGRGGSLKKHPAQKDKSQTQTIFGKKKRKNRGFGGQRAQAGCDRKGGPSLHPEDRILSLISKKIGLGFGELIRNWCCGWKNPPP